VPDLIEAIMSNLRAVIDEYLAAFTYILPRAVGTVFVLVLGWLMGRLFGKAVAAVVKLGKADDALKGTPIGSYLAKAGYSLSTLMDLLTRITVYLFSIAVAIRILKVPEAFALAQSLFDVVGRIVIGTIVFVVGLLIVEKVFDIAAKILVGEGGRTPLALSLVHALLVLLVIAAAFSASGVDLSPLAHFVSAFAQGVGIGLGVAVVVITIVVFREELLEFAKNLRGLGTR
jgi:hypothetical protein